MTYLLVPPTVRMGPAGFDGRYKQDQGIALLVTGAVVVEKQWPTPQQLDSADRHYLGGHQYLVSDAEATLLTAAGFGSDLTVADVYVDTDEENY